MPYLLVVFAGGQNGQGAAFYRHGAKASFVKVDLPAAWPGEYAVENDVRFVKITN
jgi:hypothetical protein